MDKKFYVTFAQIQNKLDKFYQQHHETLNLPAVLTALYSEKKCLEYVNNTDYINTLYHLPQEEFLRKKDFIYIEHNIHSLLTQAETDVSYFSGYDVDVFLDPVFRNLPSHSHTHFNFEFDYIFKGTCTFYFEGETITLAEGHCVFISPNATHNFSDESEDSFILRMYINYETFRSAFISLLSGDNVLSNFFKAILTNKDHANYLLLSTGDSETIHDLARSIFLEQYKYDNYSPQCTLNWLKLFFSNILRYFGDTYQFSNYATGVDFVPILKYIDKNYKNTTLGDMASEFNYSISYLSTIIKQMTGKTYSEMIKELKMKDARDYLLQTGKSIEEIAALSGYNNVDHFSKTFRAYYSCSPQQFRKQQKATVKS